MFDKLNASQRKMLNWLGFCIVIGVGFMIIQPPEPTAPPESVTQPVARSLDGWSRTNSYEERIEQELTTTLSQIEGVGTVKVFTTLDRGPHIVVAESITEDRRTVEENDQAGGIRVTEDIRHTASPVTLRLEGERKEVPLIIEEYDPIIRGVLVVATGAHHSDVRYMIAKAVQTVLQIPMYKIEVLPKEN